MFESERLGWRQVSRFPQGFGLHTAKGISGTLLPTALNNFKAHFPPLKRISCARRRQGTARGRRGERRGEASYSGLHIQPLGENWKVTLVFTNYLSNLRRPGLRLCPHGLPRLFFCGVRHHSASPGQPYFDL